MTTTAAQSHGPLRGTVAVVLGIITVIFPTIVTDIVMHATGIFPPPAQPMADSLLLLALAYRSVYGVAGSYVAARLAPSRPMAYALALGMVGCAVSTVGVVATWGSAFTVGHEWYPITLAVTAIPCAWLGGAIISRAHPSARFSK